jgi:hypothetical protein
MVLTGVLRATQLAGLGCLVLALIRPAGVDVRRVAALSMAIAITAFTTGSAGYAEILLFFLVFYEPWRGPVRIAILLAAYLMCLPVDYAIMPVVHGPLRSWLGGRWVSGSFGVSIGQILRPALLLVIQTGLIVINLQDIFRRAAAARRSDDDGLTCPASDSGLSGAQVGPSPVA